LLISLYKHVYIRQESWLSSRYCLNYQVVTKLTVVTLTNIKKNKYKRYLHILIQHHSKNWRLTNVGTMSKVIKELSWKSLSEDVGICYWKGTCNIRTWPHVTFSHTKWISISMCFVRWCWTRLQDKYTTLTLSQ